LSDAFSIQYGLKEGDTLSPLLFSFVLEYTIRKVQMGHADLWSMVMILTCWAKLKYHKEKTKKFY